MKIALSAAQALDFENALRLRLSKESSGEKRMYDMLMYFFGYLNEQLEPIQKPAGKRFRPALSFFLAQAYGARDFAFDAALALELFHNFTLIHDDVEDRDETRRGRPTLWKLFGENHAINAGDALSLIAYRVCVEIARKNSVLAQTFMDAFAEVIEAQFLDFERATAPLESSLATEKGYDAMTEKKSGALIGAAAEVAGIVGGVDVRERTLLRTYGRALGDAYQMADDYRSIWASSEETGKDFRSDIREKKRTLPIVIAYQSVAIDVQKKLARLYTSPGQLTEKEIEEVYTIIDTTKARSYMAAHIQVRAEHAKSSARKLSLGEDAKGALCEAVDLLANV